MDELSEVESKFSADGIEAKDLFESLSSLIGDNATDITHYKTVSGWDKYYQQGSNWLRHRCDGDRKTSVLTCKVRKSAGSITDRHEVDMPIQEAVSSDTVEAFLKLSGWKLGFEIQKTSYIFHLATPTHKVCVALYDVWQENEVRLRLPGGFEVFTVAKEKTEPRRFLEVEIEKDSACTHDQALEYLKSWVQYFQMVFALDEPLNESLFEMYRPKTAESAMISLDPKPGVTQ